MSLVITIYSEEGIVLAGDSRTTMSGVRKENDKIIQDFAIHYTETANKVFICPNHVGISVCNEASYNGTPLAGYIQSFILSEIRKNTPANQVPVKLMAFMNKFSPVPDTLFHVAGYEQVGSVFQAKVWTVAIRKQEIKNIDTAAAGATWSGESDILARLIQPVYCRNEKGDFQELRTSQIPWNMFTLQDAVDFAVYAIGTTRDTMRFQMRPKTVGGPIDVLVLKPNQSFWVQKKELSLK